MIKETTNYQIPMPHPQHDLQTDVYRLRAAIEQIDTLLRRLDDGVKPDHEARLQAVSSQLSELSGQLASVQSDLQGTLTRLNEQSAQSQGKIQEAFNQQNQSIAQHGQNLETMRALIFAAL